MSRLLLRTVPPMRGEDVSLVQSALRQLYILNLMGLVGTDQDRSLGLVVTNGAYDADTERGVRRFQEVIHLGIDGEVGPQTWAVISAEPSALRAVWAACRCVGMTEEPKGTDRIAFSRWWGVFSKWCIMFCSWCWSRAGVILCDGWKGKGAVPGKGSCSAPGIKRWAEETRRWEPAGNGYIPRTGDICIFALNRKAPLDATHGCMVVRFWKGIVYMVEGNYSDSVCATHYTLNDPRILGFIRVR